LVSSAWITAEAGTGLVTAGAMACPWARTGSSTNEEIIASLMESLLLKQVLLKTTISLNWNDCQENYVNRNIPGNPNWL
jgi:hypothetical protein